MEVVSICLLVYITMPLLSYSILFYSVINFNCIQQFSVDNYISIFDRIAILYYFSRLVKAPLFGFSFFLLSSFFRSYSHTILFFSVSESHVVQFFFLAFSINMSQHLPTYGT